jgi:hypothetical protein
LSEGAHAPAGAGRGLPGLLSIQILRAVAALRLPRRGAACAIVALFAAPVAIGRLVALPQPPAFWCAPLIPITRALQKRIGGARPARLDFGATRTVKG